MSATLARRPVPREFLGQARLLLARIRAEEGATNAVMGTAVRPVFDRMIRHPERRLRDGKFRDAICAWKMQPAVFRLRFVAKVEPRGRYGRAVEERLGSTRVRNKDWDEGTWEAGATLHFVDFEVPAKKLQVPTLHYQPLANLSLHALARRLERGGPVTDADLIEEMRQVAKGFRGVQDEGAVGDTLQIDVAQGRWSGDLNVLEDPEGEPQFTFLVRTFLS